MTGRNLNTVTHIDFEWSGASGLGRATWSKGDPAWTSGVTTVSAERMNLFGHFETLLTAAVERPATPLSALPLLTAGERRQDLHRTVLGEGAVGRDQGAGGEHRGDERSGLSRSAALV